MFKKVQISLSVDEKKDNVVIEAKLSAVARGYPGPVFIIGSWQSGDFAHVYAAAVRHFSADPRTPLAVLILVAEDFGAKTLIADTEFAIASICPSDGLFTLFCTDPISKNRAAEGMTRIMKVTPPIAIEPYGATFFAKDVVQRMTQGQPLTPVWGSLVRGESPVHFKAYTDICTSFFQEYVERFGMSTGREKFVVLWARTSGMPTIGRPLGGANPQYDSSESGNQQLCLNLKHRIPSIKAIFIVGEGFNAETRRIPHVFDLGAFWRRQDGIMGRFQENGFFDYMTAFYDCDVVHVGMKSGGMDTLGIWGQKVVFIDSVRSPEITKGRVAAWTTANLMPVEIGAMPTPMGKAIELARSADPKAFKTTFSKTKEVTAMAEIARSNELDDLFENEDLGKIAFAVNQMFG